MEHETVELISEKVKQLNSQLQAIYDLAGTGFSVSDLREIIGVAVNIGGGLFKTLNSELNATENIQDKYVLANEIEPKSNQASGARKHRPIPHSSFAARLRLALKERGITQAELAKDIGVSQSVVSSIVTGKVIEAGIVRSSVIAIAVGVRLDWLLYGEGEMNSHPFFGSNKAED